MVCPRIRITGCAKARLFILLSSLELESWRTKGHPDRSWDVQDTCYHSIIYVLTTFLRHFSPENLIFPHQDDPC